mgnify:FL=1
MKILVISHIADPDGVTPIILSKLVFKEFDYILSENKDVNNNVKNNLANYDFIYVIDLNISEELADFIENNYKDKVKIIDHHLSCEQMNKYSFIEVNASGKESATSLYYQYLIANYDNDLLNNENTKMLVEHVRTMDVYDFSKTTKEEASKIEMLFKIYGKDNFIDKFYKVIIDNLELYSQEDLHLIQLEKDRVKRYIEDKRFIEATIDNKRVGIVFAEINVSELGNYLINKYDYLDYIILINMDKKISYRGNGKVDLSVIAKKYGGGGHIDAAGNCIPLDLKEKVIKKIFHNAIIKGENNGN